MKEEQPVPDEIMAEEEHESDINILGVAILEAKPVEEEPVQKPVVEEPVQKPVVEEPVIEKCKDNQVMRNGSYLKNLTKKICDEFSVPNIATENTSCLPMNQEEKVL